MRTVTFIALPCALSLWALSLGRSALAGAPAAAPERPASFKPPRLEPDPNLLPTRMRYATATREPSLCWLASSKRVVTNAAPLGHEEGVYLADVTDGSVTLLWPGTSHHPICLADGSVAWVGRSGARGRAKLFWARPAGDKLSITELTSNVDAALDALWRQGILFTYRAYDKDQILFFVYADGDKPTREDRPTPADSASSDSPSKSPTSSLARGWYRLDLASARASRINRASQTRLGPPAETDPGEYSEESENAQTMLLNDICDSEVEDHRGFVLPDPWDGPRVQVSMEPRGPSAGCTVVTDRTYGYYGVASETRATYRCRQDDACTSSDRESFAFFTLSDEPGQENLNVVAVP